MDTESDWEGLPQHLLDSILQRLVSYSDYVRFSVVCKPWHSVAVENKAKFVKNKYCKQLPFLMVPTEDNSEERRGLYNITQNTLYDFQLSIPYKKRLSGSSHGWVFTVQESFALTLINAFSGATIELPPIMDRARYYSPNSENTEDYVYDPEDYVCEPPEGENPENYVFDPPEVEFEVVKATLSSNPTFSPHDYIVSATYGGNSWLAFIKAGDRFWTYIDKGFELVYDVIYYKGHFFAVSRWSELIRVDLHTRVGVRMVPQVRVILPPSDVESHRTYLVESSCGDLLLVQRFLGFDNVDDLQDKNYDDNVNDLQDIDDDLQDIDNDNVDGLQHTTVGFRVFKVILHEIEKEGSFGEVEEVKNLGGDTLFLGDNHSICVSASMWPGCLPNSIYYTDDYIDILFHLPYGRRDIGVYNVENRRFATNYILDPSKKHMPPSIWIVPSI